MPSISFQPVLRDVKDVLKSDFYTIPRFQRPYSWSTENLDDFWRDVVLDNDRGYFVGPMVAYAEKGGDTFGIVDGQQRITSITLALCVLRDLFDELKAPKYSRGLLKYIEREDDDSVRHFVLRSDAAGEFLKSQFQVEGPREAMHPRTDEERSLRKAFDDISAWLRRSLDGKSIEHPDGPEHSEAVQQLVEIRDKILDLQIIWIVLDSVDDAYVIFETLNSRGKDLETVDLLKNMLLQAIKAENGDLDSARIRWTKMRETLSDAGGGANPNKFILHWWLSQREYTAERKLFRLMKRQFNKSADAQPWLASLTDDAGLYARIANPDAWGASSYEKRLKSSLLALNIFGVRQPRPVLLALLRAYEQNVIKFKALRRAVRAIEAYHYISTAVVGVSSTGGISMMYAAHAREISAATAKRDGNAVHLSIDHLVKKLQSGTSGRDTFLSEFVRLEYSTARPDARRLVAYTLRSLHDSSVTGVAFDHDRCNIEHLHPQSDHSPWVANIGNLFWIDETLNAELGTLPFDKKRLLLEKRAQTYDFSDVLAATEWGEEQIAARAQRLAELAYDRVWLIE